MKSIIESIVKNSKDDYINNQLNIIIREFNKVNQSLNKNKEKIENLLNNSNDYISKISNKNIIKGILDITNNELYKNILLFNTDIDDGINVYLNNEKKNIIKDQNKRLIDFYPTEIGKYSFEIIFNNKLTSLKCFFSECSNITSLD